MAQHYISPDGSDSDDGSQGAPWFSVSHAADQASRGDTVVVLDGTYEYGSDVQPVQTPGLTIQAQNGTQPAMAWSGDATGWENTISEGIRIEGTDSVTVDGLELRNSHSAGVQLKNSSNCTLRNLDVHRNGGMGILLTHGTPDAHLVGCDSHHNGEASTAQTADGFVFNGASGDITGTLVEECRSFENVEDGYDCWDGDGITFRHCQAFDNGRPNSETPESTSMGIGFKLGGGTYGGDNRAERCVAWGNYYAGFSDNLPAAGVQTYNCTAWNNSRNFEFSHEDSELVNNISYEGPENVSSGVGERGNSWNQGIDDPGFLSLDRSSSEFLRLSADSACVDAGVDVDLDYEGDAPDLGAFERGAETDNETDSGTDSESGGGLYYHDGSGWQPVGLQQ